MRIASLPQRAQNAIGFNRRCGDRLVTWLATQGLVSDHRAPESIRRFFFCTTSLRWPGVSRCGLPLSRSSVAAGNQSIEVGVSTRSEEHTSELQSLLRISYAVFCVKKKKPKTTEAPVYT